ncbi:MAG: rhodanese-like domain-containing protein [Rivularia sp. (in: Bacteria)]|nr:rhodanese-like domain-containing protein [Rivularia sp. MS3]
MTSFVENKLQEVDAAKLKQWMEEDKALLIDVREKNEFATEHIPGAKLMPLSHFHPERISNEARRKVVLQCQSGNCSAKVTDKMFLAGLRDITYLKGGLAAWKSAGYPTELNTEEATNIFRQAQIFAGCLVILGIILGAFISPWFLIISGLVGAQLVFAGITDTIALTLLLAKLSYNQPKVKLDDMLV